MSSPNSRETSAHVRVLRALFWARKEGIGRGWINMRGIRHRMQCHESVALAGINEAFALGHVEQREVMGQVHFRITPLGGGYYQGLQAAERGE